MTSQRDPEVRTATLRELRPDDLRVHRDARNRRLHLVATTLALIVLLAALLTRGPQLLLLAPLAVCGFAWLGHLVVDRNRPATLRYPCWSLRCDHRL